MRDEEAPKGAQETNWFSAPSALSIYGHYLNLDKDHNGMLSKAELGGYGSGTLTTVFLDRLFAECITYDGTNILPFSVYIFEFFLLKITELTLIIVKCVQVKWTTRHI